MVSYPFAYELNFLLNDCILLKSHTEKDVHTNRECIHCQYLLLKIFGLLSMLIYEFKELTTLVFSCYMWYNLKVSHHLFEIFQRYYPYTPPGWARVNIKYFLKAFHFILKVPICSFLLIFISISLKVIVYVLLKDFEIFIFIRNSLRIGLLIWVL